MIFSDAFKVFAPPPKCSMLSWVRRHVKMWDDAPFDHYKSPHLGAPGGPMEAFQDPAVREIYLMFASRLGKTVFGLVAMVYISYVLPTTCFFVSATKTLVEDVIGDRAWKMIANSRIFSRLPPENRRPKRRIRLPRNQWYTGWAENPATLADKSAKIIHGNEISKFRYLRGTKEAHPWDLARERAKEHPDRKVIGESTPTVKKKCTIEAGFELGWGCRFMVPCPHCIKYQRLELGKGEKGGIVFDRAPSGRMDEAIAQRTARYVCLYCAKSIRDEHRPWMMRHGVWVPAGCDVDHEAAFALFEDIPENGTHWDNPHRPYVWAGWKHASWIKGTPLRDGEVASYQLSTIYSLFTGWGEIAAQFVRAMLRPALLRNFVNSWLGETYEETRHTEEWETVLKRLVTKTPARVIPEGFSVLTCGVDVQHDHFVFVAVAGGRPRRYAVVDYGTAESLDEIKQLVLEQRFDHMDGGRKLYVRRSLIDTGFDPADEQSSTIHAWARKASAELQRKGQTIIIRGCKGNSKPLGQPYLLKTLGPDSTCPGAQHVLVDPDFTQTMVDRGLYGAQPHEQGGLQVYGAEPYEHEDFMRQLMNDAPQERLNAKKELVREWARIDETIPNDYRAGLRYGMAALLMEARNADFPLRVRDPEPEQPRTPRSEPRESGFKTPDGRNFFVNER